MAEYLKYFLNTEEDAGPAPELPPAGELDCQGIPLKVGDKVAWSIGGRSNSGLSFGVVSEVATPSYHLVEHSVHFETERPEDWRNMPYTERDKQTFHYAVVELRWALRWTSTKVQATRKGRKGVARRGSELIHYLEAPSGPEG